MRALHKSKRVSWPPDFKLCQVRLFISDDSPSQVGSEFQDHLQAKSHQSEDNLPPGFGGPLPANESQIKLSDIPVINWKCSIRIMLDEEWRVVAGEENKEVEAQNQRELRVLEAFYPGASAIPPNPSFPADVDNSDYDDQQTVVIPILPVEDDEIALDSASDLPTQSGVNVGTEPPRTDENTSLSSILPVGSEIMAALTAISNNKELGNGMIDQDLLMKILSNPKLVENLVANSDNGAGSVSSNANSPYLSSTHEANGVVTTTPASSNGQYYPRPTVTHTPSMTYPPPASSDQPNYGAPPARDASYYKSLIQQHGGERQDTPPVQQHTGYHRYNPQPGGPNPEMANTSSNNQRPRDSKPKIMKPCMYFNSSRGCRNGANCLYQHDAAAYQPRNPNNGNINNPEMQSAKRMRFDRD